MVFLACLPLHARHRDGTRGSNDRGEAPPQHRRRASGGLRTSLILLLALWPALAPAEPIRIATYTVDWRRAGPGLQLKDIQQGNAADVEGALSVIALRAPDVLLLTGIDHDLEGATLSAFAQRLTEVGVHYPHLYTSPPNSGLRTDLDMNGDGRTGGPRDAQGFGHYPGEGGMALLSRFPIRAEGVLDFTAMLWRDLPGASLPTYTNGDPFPSAAAQAIQRLSSVNHWAVPVDTPDGEIWLLTLAATPPVFDGAEDQNGLRNRDEIRLWRLFLNGRLALQPPEAPVVVLGKLNADPYDGEGARTAVQQLLDHPRLQDTQPQSMGGASQADKGHAGAPSLDTADWPDENPGNLRADYVVPDVRFKVLGDGVHWPAPGTPGAEEAQAASRHRLVWVDLDF